MVRVQVIDGEPARAKGRFGRCDAERVLVQFEYLFETADATEIVVYLSDVPDLLDHDDPLRDQHYVEIGRVPAPPEGRPGAFGSGRFGVFEEWAFVRGPGPEQRDVGRACSSWVVVRWRENLRRIRGTFYHVCGEPDGSAVFDSLSVQVHCSGYCLDLNFTKTVDSEDLHARDGGPAAARPNSKRTAKAADTAWTASSAMTATWMRMTCTR